MASRAEFAQQGGATNDPSAANLFDGLEFALVYKVERLPCIAADCLADFGDPPQEVGSGAVDYRFESALSDM
jgi:hypothetical protein